MYMAFHDTGITSVALPQSVRTIGNYAFYKCKALQDMTIPSSVTNIGNGAFAETSLRTVVIPDSVQGIARTAAP